MMRSRDVLGRVYGIRVSVLEQSGPGGAQSPLAVEIRGPDVAELQRISDRALAMIDQIPGVVELQSSIGSPRPEFRIEIDRGLANRIRRARSATSSFRLLRSSGVRSKTSDRFPFRRRREGPLA
jgi:hypothetical protein